MNEIDLLKEAFSKGEINIEFINSLLHIHQISILEYFQIIYPKGITHEGTK